MSHSKSDSGVPESYYVQITAGAKQVCVVIQIHEYCSGTAENSSDIWL